MRRVLFIMTHEGSGWENLVEHMMADKRFDFFQTGNGYHHPDDLQMLTSNPHRRENAVAVWSDVILYNKDFTCRSLRDHCKFLYFEGPCTIPKRQYNYRLQGMRWYHQKTGGPWIDNLEVDSLLTSIYG